MLPLTPDAIVVAAEHQVSCNVDDESALLNLATGVYYGLNPMGSYIWKLVQQPISYGTLRDRLLGEFGAEHQTVEQDLRQFLDEMVTAGLIQLSN